MQKVLRIIKMNWALFTATILAAISIFSLYPVERLPDISGSDKTNHLIAYAILAFPVALAKPKMWQPIITGFMIYSGVIELVQPYVNRYGEWLDLAANAAGLIIGVIIAYFANIIFNDNVG